MSTLLGTARGLSLRPNPPEPTPTRRKSHIVRAGTDAGPQSGAALRKNPSLYAAPEAPLQNNNSSDSSASSTNVVSTLDTASELKISSGLKFTPVPIKHKPEVLAPAGGWPQLQAAVENGADAVYFGVGELNARARASNFSSEELPTVMQYLHERGVKGYLVLNVLVFDDELELLAQRAQEAYAAGVDAVIVQDIGAVEVIGKAAPGLAVHGSTQMTITSAQGAAFAKTVRKKKVPLEISYFFFVFSKPFLPLFAIVRSSL